MNKIRIVFAIVMLCLGLFSCAQQSGFDTYVEETNTSALQADTNTALIIIYRSGFLGWAATKNYYVYEDGQKIAYMKYDTYSVHRAKPGTHLYTAVDQQASSVTLTVEAGKTYYLDAGYQNDLFAYGPSLEVGSAEAFGSKKDSLTHLRLNHNVRAL